jgi:hypothetical protein
VPLGSLESCVSLHLDFFKKSLTPALRADLSHYREEVIRERVRREFTIAL